MIADPQQRQARSRFLRYLPFLAFAMVLVSIWLPEFLHYFVWNTALSQAVVEASRRLPDQAVMDEIGRIRVLHPWRAPVEGEGAIAKGEEMLRGEYVAENGTRVRFDWPFNPDDLTKGPVDWTLAVAAFVVPDRLLKAYEASHRDEFLSKAVDYALRWQDYEGSAWLPRGLAENDHAIAERVFVLTDLWRAYRNHPLFDPAVAERILRLTRRSAELLARRSHFTYATNHGVMQNLALLQVAIAMPALPDAGRYFKTGRDRLVQQLGFYVSPEGVILEHSVGYHTFGMELLAIALRDFELAAEAPPDALVAAVEKGRRVTAHLIRPDGSLPLIGDTHAVLPNDGPSRLEVAEQSASADNRVAPPLGCVVFPISGYAVWWNTLGGSPALQEFSQMVASWSYFPGHGHKHADELSILLWAAGQDWVSNVGYWAYEHPDRAKAESWDGSNSPHAMGESPTIERESLLRAFACGNSVAVLDMERATRDGLRVRRQIVQASASVWVVIDSAQDRQDRPLVTDWTFDPRLELAPGPLPSGFRAGQATGKYVLDLVFVGSEGMRIEPVHASSIPFAGWIYGTTGPVPASGLIVEQRRNPSWVATAWVLNRAQSSFAFEHAPDITWRSAESWDISLALPSGQLQVVRNEDKIRIGSAEVLAMTVPTPDVASGRVKILAAFQTAQNEFPRYRDLIRYRSRATYVVVGLCLVQLGVLLALPRKLHALGSQLRWTMSVGWLLLGVWLQFYYFAR